MNESVSLAQPVTLEQELHRINTTLIPQHQFLEALRQLMLLAKDHVTDAQLWLLIGNVYTRMAHWTDAIGALETAIALNPRLIAANRLRALALFSMGKKQEACDLIDKVVKQSSDSGDWMMRAYIHQHTNDDPIKALQVARDWGRRFADPLTRTAKPLRVKDRNPRKRLKIGYVTADFRQHSVAFFMQPILANHDPEQVEVHVFSNGPSDFITKQMQALVPHWHDVQSITDEQLLRKIRAEGIDILVDLSGFTHGHRLGVFARRAAPVQVTWLGYMQTLGMKAMDYRLVDPGIVSPNQVSYYSEKLFYLHTMATYVPPDYSPLCTEAPMLRNGYPTLVSLNNSAKITDQMLRVWSRILHMRSDARLIIIVKEQNADVAQAHMQPRVEAAGMPIDRVFVLPQQPLDRFMEIGHIADIALDTSPISGGTTTLHTLWMGLYVIALENLDSVDVSSARILQSFGLSYCVTHDENEYVERVLQLLRKNEELKKWRVIGRERMLSSPIMNYKERTSDLEKAYRLMWLNYLCGKFIASEFNFDINEFSNEMRHSNE